MTGARPQQPPLVQPAAGEGGSAIGWFSLRKMLPIDREHIQRKLIPWAMRGGLAIFDQGVFAGSNFVIGVMLARRLSPEQYGTYAVAFAVFLLLLMVYQALLLEPMLVFGGSAYRNCLRGYVKALLLLHLGVSLMILFVMSVAAGVALKLGQGNELPSALVAVGFAAPMVLLFWLLKRVFYLRLSPAPSAGGALFYCALVIGGLTLVYKHGLLSPLSAFLLMGLGGLGASILLLTYLALWLPASQDAPSLSDTWHRHWRYGRWALGANAMMWIPFNIFYPLLSSFSGLGQAAQLKALMNFAAPVLQTCMALYPLLLPYAARVLAERGATGASFVLRRMTVLFVSCAVPYWVLLFLFRGPAFRILYSGRYGEVAYLLPTVALASVFSSAFFGPSILLRAMESPGLVLAAVSASSCVSVAIGIPLTQLLGVRGAVWSMALSEALAFVAAVILLRRKSHRSSETVPTFPVSEELSRKRQVRNGIALVGEAKQATES